MPDGISEADGAEAHSAGKGKGVADASHRQPMPLPFALRLVVENRAFGGYLDSGACGSGFSPTGGAGVAAEIQGGGVPALL